MSRNVIKEYVDFCKKDLRMYAKKIMGKYYDEQLFTKYLDVYINVRYYNQESWVRKDFDNHIYYYLNSVYEKNNSDISKFMLSLVKLYYYVDEVYSLKSTKDVDKYVSFIQNVRKTKLGLDESTFVVDMKKKIDYVRDKKSEYINSFNSNDFKVELKKVDDNIYDVMLVHSVCVPKVFSNYAINKVWNSKLISENKLQVEYYLVNQKILKNIINGNFNNIYLVDFCISLFDKPEKLKRTFRIIDNDVSKEEVVIKIKYDYFISNKEIILKYIKLGYQFALIIDSTYSDSSNKDMFDIFKYVIVDNEKYMTNYIKDRKNFLYIN